MRKHTSNTEKLTMQCKTELLKCNQKERIHMVKLNDVIKELEGVKVTVKGNEIDLTGMTYLEFMVMSEELNDKELQPVLDAIVDKIGEEGLANILAKFDELVETMEDEDFEEEIEESKPNTQPIVLDPIKMVDMNDFYSFQPNLVVKGIDSVSEICGKYMALVNVGMTNKQAFEVATYELMKEHEMAMIDKQIKLKELELEAQVKMSGVKQLLNR